MRGEANLEIKQKPVSLDTRPEKRRVKNPVLDTGENNRDILENLQIKLLLAAILKITL